MNLNRRKLLTGIGVSLLAAPAIVKFAHIMPVKSMDINNGLAAAFREMAKYEWQEVALGYSITYQEISNDMRLAFLRWDDTA